MKEHDRRVVESALCESDGPDALGCHSDTCQELERIAAAGNLGVDYRACWRKSLAGNVVVGHKDIQTMCLCVVDLSYAGNSAVHRDGQSHTVVYGLSDAVDRHSIGVVPHGNGIGCIQSHGPEFRDQKGRACYAVDIPVSEDTNLLAVLDGLQDTVTETLHVLEEERIMQKGDIALQIELGGLGRAYASACKNPCR